jgi:hypothetical protein
MGSWILSHWPQQSLQERRPPKGGRYNDYEEWNDLADNLEAEFLDDGIGEDVAGEQGLLAV